MLVAEVTDSTSPLLVGTLGVYLRADGGKGDLTVELGPAGGPLPTACDALRADNAARAPRSTTSTSYPEY